MGGWHCADGTFLDEADGEPEYYDGQLYSSKAAVEYQKSFERQLPCFAIDGNLSTMGRVARCNIVDESTHRAKCTTCGKVGWYSERGRIAEEKGISVFDVIDQKK